MDGKLNVLILFTDDQRFDTIHALGNEEIATPNLDRLVKDGTAFTHAHIMGGTCGAVCMPSRAMLMTGRSLFHLYGHGSKNGAVIPEFHPTMPETFRNSGYHTHHIGKWHQDKLSFLRSFESADRIFGFTDGWYENYGGHFNIALHDFDPMGEYPNENGYMLKEDGKTKVDVGTAAGGRHSSDIFADAAVNFINDYSDDRPFFMYVSFVAPHDPRQSTDEYEDMYTSESVSLPPNYMPKHPFDNGDLYVRDERLEWWPRRKRAIRKHIADYYAMISHADAAMGRIIDALAENGMDENTIIVFAGDNGLAVGQHGLMGKQNLYDHSIRVPLIFKGPGIPSDKRSDAFCYLYDVFPTLCSLTDIEKPDTVEGISLDSVISGEEKSMRSDLFTAYRNCQRAVRDNKYKLIKYFTDEETTTQLFDMTKDRWEMNNLATKFEYAAIRQRLEEKMVNYMREHHDPIIET